MLDIKEEELKKILPSDGPSTIEVKKYLEKYNDEYIVIKCGGSVLVDPNLFKIFIRDVVVLNKQDLNPALYKMLNTENLAVYLIFSLVALISMFNLVGSLTIMMVEKKKDLRVLKSLGGQEGDFNKIFFALGVFTSVFGALLGIIVAWVVVAVQNSFSLVVVPGTALPYPISLTVMNILIVFSTIFFLGLVTSAWSTRLRKKS